MKNKNNQLTPKKKLPLNSDIVFRRVFSKEGNEPLLKSLLEAILDIKIKSVKVKNPQISKDLYDSKAGVLDIKVEIDENIICDVEMQVTNEKNIEKRSTYYMASAVTETIHEGDTYQCAKKVIVINILNFNYFKRNSYHSIAHMKFEDSNPQEYVEMGYQIEDKIATPDIEMHFLELPKFIKKNPEANTELEQWLWLIAGKEEKIEMAKKENEEIKKATDIIDQMSMNPEEWEMYMSRKKAIINYNSGISQAKEDGKKEGIKQGIKQGIEQGIKQGIRKEKLKVAKELLKTGMAVEKIVEITELSKEEVEKIKID